MQKMQGWKQNLLSQAGREVIIKSVVQATPAYAMACSALLKKFTDRLNSYTSNFWWGGDPSDHGIHWASWDSLSVVKSQGGMDFRDFKAFNLALLAKQVWRLLKSPASLCAQILEGLYYPNVDILMARSGRQPSWAWSSLLQGRDLLNWGLQWQVGNGKSIHFWEAQWVPYSRTFKVMSSQQPRC